MNQRGISGKCEQPTHQDFRELNSVQAPFLLRKADQGLDLHQGPEPGGLSSSMRSQ